MGAVSTHSRTEAAAKTLEGAEQFFVVSTHSRTEAAASNINKFLNSLSVSTHSRTEAAAPALTTICRKGDCFNTQPHGGGCGLAVRDRKANQSFNTQPHGGGCFDF